MNYYGNEKVYAKVIGLTVDNVKDATLYLSDGARLEISLDGECCSMSEFTDMDQFKELIGAKIQKIEERDGTSDLVGRVYPDDDDDDAECRSWHFLVFETDKGHVTVDWHNDSNGCYDGEVCLNLVVL